MFVAHLQGPHFRQGCTVLIYRPPTLKRCLFIFIFKLFFFPEKNLQHPQKKTHSFTGHHTGETASSLHPALTEQAQQSEVEDGSEVSRPLHCGLMSSCSSACLCDQLCRFDPVYSVVKAILVLASLCYPEKKKELQVMEVMRNDGALDISALL